MRHAVLKQLAQKAAAGCNSPRTRGTFSWMLHCMKTTAFNWGTQIKEILLNARFHYEWLVQYNSYTYFLQLKASEDFARRCFSAVVVFTLPVVGLVSICKREVCHISKALKIT
jgi:hypothetical protein